MVTRRRRPWLSTGELAELLGVDPRSIRYWIAAGRIEPDQTTLGGYARFKQSTARRIKRSIDAKNRKAA